MSFKFCWQLTTEPVTDECLIQLKTKKYGDKRLSIGHQNKQRFTYINNSLTTRANHKD